LEKLKKEHGEIDLISAGSSLKFCLVAEGKADIYPRFAPTMEWDTAAAHAVVNAAGGKIHSPGLLPLGVTPANILTKSVIFQKCVYK